MITGDTLKKYGFLPLADGSFVMCEIIDDDSAFIVVASRIQEQKSMMPLKGWKLTSENFSEYVISEQQIKDLLSLWPIVRELRRIYFSKDVHSGFIVKGIAIGRTHLTYLHLYHTMMSISIANSLFITTKRTNDNTNLLLRNNSGILLLV